MVWQPGQSGNPAGRKPREHTVSHWLTELLSELNGGGAPVAKSIAKKIITESKKGEPWAIKELLDRTEGKPKQALEHSGDPDNPVRVGLIEVCMPREEE